MSETIAPISAYLALDRLITNPVLARRLPPDLACRFHALPVAQDRGCITVVMADPSDSQARAAVVSALGPESCVVQGDARKIDALLAEIWGHEAYRPPRALLCAFPGPAAAELQSYSQALGDLLGTQIEGLTTAGGLASLVKKDRRVPHDLVFFGQADHPLIHTLLESPRREATSLPLAVLVAQQPRWPLHRILLVVQGQGTDDNAVEWVVRLAWRSGSRVTALAVVPPMPGMYGRRGRLSQGLPELLTSSTKLGQQMRRVARHLVDWEIESSLCLCEGVPERQVQRMMIEGEYDLLAVAASPHTVLSRCLAGDLSGSLLRRMERPLLIAAAQDAT